MKIAKKNILYDLVGLLAIWITAILIIKPIGNFPLNDDWAFAITVNKFLTTGRYHPSGWGAMTLFSQVMWGSLVGGIFGFSHSVLRISTLGLSFVGLVAIYLIARKLTPSRWLVFFMTLLIAFNILFFPLSFTFMTDIPFAVFSIISIFFYIENLQNPSPKNVYFVLGTFFSIISVLNRQIGLFVPLTFAIANLVKYGLQKQRLLQSLLSVSLTIMALFCFNYWLQISGKTPSKYGLQIHQLINIINSPSRAIKHALYYGFVIIMYLGLFLSPLLILWYGSIRKKFSIVTKISFLSFISLLIITIGLYFLTHRTMPYLGNVFTINGIGPLTLYDSYVLGKNYPFDYGYFNISSRIFITALSVLGGALLIGFLLSKLLLWKTSQTLIQQVDKSQIVSLFLLVGLLIYLSPILLIGGFDRYLIIPVILVALSIVSDIKIVPIMRFKICAIGIFSVFLVFSVVATHDYLSWNKTRWVAIESLLNKKIMPSEIDGGFEFNGQYLYDPDYQRMPSKSWWWVYDNNYIITFGEIAGYTPINKYEFSSWMPSMKNSIYVLKRN